MACLNVIDVCGISICLPASNSSRVGFDWIIPVPSAGIVEAFADCFGENGLFDALRSFDHHIRPFSRRIASAASSLEAEIAKRRMSTSVLASDCL